MSAAQPHSDTIKQKIYIPISATALNKDKRLAELGSRYFLQDCEQVFGQDEFSCHYLETGYKVRFFRYSRFENSHPDPSGLLDFQNFESLKLELSRSASEKR